MSNSIKRYKVFCITENTYYEYHRVNVPTTCHNGHNLDQSKTIILYEIPIISKNYQTLVPRNQIINTTSYTDLNCNFIFNRSIMSQITNVKVLGYVDSGCTCDINVYNTNNNTVIISNNL